MPLPDGADAAAPTRRSTFSAEPDARQAGWMQLTGRTNGLIASTYAAAAPVYAQPSPVYAYPAPSYGYYDSWPYYWGYPTLSLGFGFGGGYYYGGYHGGGYYGGGYHGGYYGGGYHGGGGGHH